MKIAVTGGSGFIGKNLLKILVNNKKNKIINLYRKKKFNHTRVKNIKFDISKKIKKNFYIDIGAPEYLIHLAWENLDNYDSKFHKKTLKQNIIFFKKFLKTPIKKIFVMGTCFEYGIRNGELKENFKTNPYNNYSASKDKLRKILFNNFKNKKTIILWGRLFYIFGKGQNSRTLYGQISTTIKKRKKFFNMSIGDQKRDYLKITDLVNIITNILKKSNKSEVINICSGKPVSLKILVNNWLRKKKYKLKINYGYYNYSKNEAKNFWGNTDKLKRILKLNENI